MRTLVVALLLLLCACEADPPTSYRDVSYDPRIPERRLDLYVPRSRSQRPLVVYFHGGGWQKGTRQNGLDGWSWLLDRGYAVATVDYRLSGEARYPAAVQDCRAAVRALRRDADKYGLDPSRIALAGNSAGAHLAALLALTPGDPVYDDGTVPGVSDDVSAVVGEGGPYDLLPSDIPLDDSIAGFLGVPPQANPELHQQASPLFRVAPGAPAFLLLHGEQDAVVPIAEAQAMTDALSAQGDAVQLVRVQNAGHGLVPVGAESTTPETSVLRDQIESFLRDQFREHPRP